MTSYAIVSAYEPAVFKGVSGDLFVRLASGYFLVGVGLFVCGLCAYNVRVRGRREPLWGAQLGIILGALTVLWGLGRMVGLVG